MEGNKVESSMQEVEAPRAQSGADRSRGELKSGAAKDELHNSGSAITQLEMQPVSKDPSKLPKLPNEPQPLGNANLAFAASPSPQSPSPIEQMPPTGGHGQQEPVAPQGSCNRLAPPTLKKMAEAYVGNNRICCRGTLIYGPDYTSHSFSYILILIPTALFFAFVVPNLDYGVYVGIVGACTISAAILFLFLTSSSNPGIIQRNEPVSEDQLIPLEVATAWKSTYLPYRWCRTCNIYRNPRASHCHICNNCVERFDHHCPWTGTCIGLNNYRFFFWFLAFTIISVIYDIVFSILLLTAEGPNEFWTVCKRHYMMPLVLVVYLVFVLLSVGPLFGFHVYLTATAQTTREVFKECYKHGNPFSRGLFLNLFDVCRTPRNPLPPPETGGQNAV